VDQLSYLTHRCGCDQHGDTRHRGFTPTELRLCVSVHPRAQRRCLRVLTWVGAGDRVRNTAHGRQPTTCARSYTAHDGLDARQEARGPSDRDGVRGAFWGVRSSRGVDANTFSVHVALTV
jgi:hypothetical protein